MNFNLSTKNLGLEFKEIEILNVGNTSISDISLLEKNKHNKKRCENINDYIPLSNLEKLEI